MRIKIENINIATIILHDKTEIKLFYYQSFISEKPMPKISTLEYKINNISFFLLILEIFVAQIFIIFFIFIVLF